MLNLFRTDRRLLLVWTALTAVVATAGLAIHHLHRAYQAELSRQARQALDLETTRLREQIATVTDFRRRQIIKALASFHVEGLTHSLHAWAASDPTIVGTFEWDPSRGFLAGSTIPAAFGDPAGTPTFWAEFAAWRGTQSAATRAEPRTRAAWSERWLPTRGNPDLPEAELKYQAENLDLLTDANQPVDPWAGWAGNLRSPSVPWLFWYRPGPDAPVRGCFVDIAPLVAALQSDGADPGVARLQLLPGGTDSAAAVRIALTDTLPGYELAGDFGALFTAKQSDARWSVLLVVLLLGVLFVAGAALTFQTRREIRDAARKTTFVAQVSHELRTPLTSIRMFADLLATPGLADEKRLRYAGSIGRESARLGDLVERLLAFNALERGRLAVQLAPVDVGALVQETLLGLDGTLRAAGLTPRCDLPDNSVLARTDASVLKQALINLVDNAAKYAAAGGSIELRLRRDGATVRLRVTDAGPGVPADLRPRLFEPFVQGGTLLTDKSPGVGLGLSLARGSLRRAGGDLVLLPDGPGARFEIQLSSVS